jgi:hypothetical protein
MKRILSFLSVICLLALPATAMLNNNDLIWEGNAAGFGATMKAKYKESPENGLIDQTIEVEVQNAPRNTTLNVSAAGFSLGTMITDNTGRGAFRMDIFNQQPDGNGRVDGPRLETGDIVRVSKGGSGLDAVLNPVP